MRMSLVPLEDVLYTFRFLRKEKVEYRTYRFYGEVTEKGRYILYDVKDKHPMDLTVQGFSYKMRKQLVRKKDLREEEYKKKKEYQQFIEKHPRVLNFINESVVEHFGWIDKLEPFQNVKLIEYCLKNIGELKRQMPINEAKELLKRKLLSEYIKVLNLKEA